jgi:hypothetical protein
MSNHFSADNLKFPGDDLLTHFPYLGPPNPSR